MDGWRWRGGEGSDGWGGWMISHGIGMVWMDYSILIIYWREYSMVVHGLRVQCSIYNLVLKLQQLWKLLAMQHGGV